MTSYYPFGTPYCDSISVSGSTLQPYKYNGKELDLMHGLNTYDYGARQLNPVLCAWDRMDQLCEKYYSISPYVYCRNNPVNRIDPDGRIVKIWYEVSCNNGYLYTFDGSLNTILNHPKNDFVQDVISAYTYLHSHGASEKFDSAIADDKHVIIIRPTDGASAPEYNCTTNLFWNSKMGIETSDGGLQSPATQLEHEFDHIVDYYKNPSEHNTRSSTRNAQYDTEEEKRVITNHETDVVKKLGESPRKDHKGSLYRTNGPNTTKTYIRNNNVVRRMKNILVWPQELIIKKDNTNVSY